MSLSTLKYKTQVKAIYFFSCFLFGVLRLIAQDYIDFNSVSTQFTNNFVEQGQTTGTTFSYSSSGGLSNSGRISVTGNPDSAVYTTPISGFAAQGTGYTISCFFRARSSTSGVTANTSIATGLLPSTASQLNVDSGTNAFLSVKVYALSTPAGTATQFSLRFCSRDGTVLTKYVAPQVFNLTNDYWYKLTTTYEMNQTGQFVGTASVDNYGPTGTATPTNVTTFTSASTPLSNNQFLGLSSMYAAIEAGTPSGAGTPSIDDFSLSFFPDPTVASREFPADSGIVNVKAAPYYAMGDGVTDDTAAIQSAISNSPGLVYFPNGTYLVTNTLKYIDTSGNWKCFVKLQGESRNGTIIKLANSCAGYGSASTPKAVVYTASEDPTNTTTGSGVAGFMNSICNLTVDVGSGNPGAVGIDYLANNEGTIRDVLVKSSDPQLVGYCGIMADRGICGPCILKNVEVDGFGEGISMAGLYMVMTLENIKLSNQKIVGLTDEGMVLAIRNLSSTNTVPVIEDTPSEYGYSSFIVLDKGELHGGSSSNYAISTGGNLYIRDVNTSGYKTAAVHSRGTDINGPCYTEFVNPPAQSLFSSKAHSLRLPVQQTPENWDNQLSDWVSVGTPNGTDDTANIQAAINNAPPGSTLYFPTGIYHVSSTVFVGSNISHIVGMMSQIQVSSNNSFTNPSNPLPVFCFQTPSSNTAIVSVEDLFIRMYGQSGAVAFEDASAKSLIVKNILVFCDGGGLANEASDGNLFLEDFGGVRVFLDYPQKVWARQLDLESGTAPMLVNSGATLWILGFKTEATGTYIATSSGGSTELMGGYHLLNVTGYVNSIPANDPAYSCVNSSESLSFATYGNNPTVMGGDYQIYVDEQEPFGSADLLLNQTYGRYGNASDAPRVVTQLSDSISQ